MKRGKGGKCRRQQKVYKMKKGGKAFQFKGGAAYPSPLFDDMMPGASALRKSFGGGILIPLLKAMGFRVQNR